MTDNDALLATIMAEFNALKTEILARSGSQHTLINLNVTFSGTLLGIVIVSSNVLSPMLLLLVPLVSTSFGFLYLDHHTAIQRAGVYLDERIRPELQRLASSTIIMSWETFFNDEFWRRTPSRIVFWAPLVVLFGLAPIGATIYTVAMPKGPLLWGVWMVGALWEIALLVVARKMFSQDWVRGYRSAGTSD